MADVPLINVGALLLEREDMDAGVVQQLKTALAESPKQFGALRDATDRLEQHLSAGKGDPGKLRLKLGVASFLLGRVERGAQVLAEAKTALGQFYLAQALIESGRPEDAIKALEQAGKLGYAASEVKLHKAAALRTLSRHEEARATLDSLENYVHGSAEFLFQYGSVQAAEGNHEKAVGMFEKAIAADPRHAGALFQLAYYNDMAGNDHEAISLYERCLQLPPARVGALINLGILYEDTERYERARICYEQVLRVYPNHERARLFLKDAEASVEQFYDEDAERRSDRYNAVLDIPVTDFELSVRSRNCLKKMNIRTVGDLTRVTEQQLLASKNFGETSLLEIKAILSIKSLRLGQALEQPTKRPHPSFNPEEYSPQEQALFNKPVSELNLSVRARKCMTRLGIATIGELIVHTGDELLECKNFGVTSLVEVRDKLKELGLKLRGD